MTSLKTVFGPSDIESMAMKFHDAFAPPVVLRNNSSGFAPSYGKLNAITIRQLDDNLKISIAGVTKVIGELPPQDRTWEAVIAAMMNAIIVAPVDQPNIIHRTENISINGLVTAEVEAILKRLIGDEAVMKSTMIDTQFCEALMVALGADSNRTFISTNHKEERTIMDVCVFRYPDLDSPTFKLYHIKIGIWRRTEQFLTSKKYDKGITCEYQSQEFEPRKSTLDRIPVGSEMRKGAIAQAEALFD